MKFIALIPARYQSTRFPGKPLAGLGGKPVIQWVYDNVSKALDNVWVATDDSRIFKTVEAFGGKAIYTSPSHSSGTDRCAEAAEILEKNTDFDVVINCTSVGMSPDVNASPLSEGCITKRMTVFDTVYNPPKTMLLKYAVNKGAKVINGLEMFVEQAVEQYKLLTGDKADKLLIEKVLREKLGI